jgi:hypothetical protein
MGWFVRPCSHTRSWRRSGRRLCIGPVEFAGLPGAGRLCRCPAQTCRVTLWYAGQDEYTALRHYQQQEKVLRETIARSIEEATSAARAKLVEWDLPGTLDSVDTPVGEIPAHLRRKMAKCAKDMGWGVGQQGGLDGLVELLADLGRRTSLRKQLLSSCGELLQREAQDDARCRHKHDVSAVYHSLSPRE